ncbi:hypothetical protein [uncultured Legionella sp.]|uniref:hypothetical protein n=1 Tax=uncultured Legionella sp. TaxID=210934 RepID=UPI002613A772|nr:hypothetical protein [uncultured Legionella sp.]
MNRLAMIAATGFLAVLLTACGDNGASKPADDKTDTTVQQTQPTDDAGKTDAGTAQPSTDGQSH